MGADSESDLKQKRTQARAKATRLLKELEDCDKTQEDDLALAIHHLEEHIKVMSEMQSWKIEWLRCKVDSQEELTVFLKFLQREMTIREEAATRKRGGTSDSTEPVPGSGKPTVSILSLRQKRDPDWVCLACGSAGPRGVRLVRALIDGGSDASFIRSSLADELGLETVGQGTFACVGFKEKLEEARQYDLVSAQLSEVERMWTLDAVGVSAGDAAEKTTPGPTWSEEENRYQMGLLWKSDCRPASNLPSAEARTRRLATKMGTEELRRQYMSLYPDLMEKVETALYMDDLCPTFSTTEEATTGMRQITEVFGDAKMELHKARMTVSKPFDPLGLLTPWLVRGKQLFQRSWTEEQLDWDDRLPLDLQEEVDAWWHDSPEPVSGISPAAEAEEKLQSSVACSHPVTRSVPPAETAALITSCSDLKTAVNRLAWVRRFLSNSRLPRAERQVGPLTPEERSQSLRFYIREAQASAYREEIGALRTGKLLPADSPLEKLHPQLSDDGVLEATLRSGERAVPVLPDLSHVTTLIVDDAHRLCFHQGTRVTLALLSAGYMVRRRTVRRVVDSCTRGRKYRGLPYRSPEGALPTFEELSVTLYELAFAINLRPLTQGDGENVLTPAHFLLGVTAIDGVICPTLTESPITRTWMHRRRVCDHLNRRWTSEYLSALRCWSTSPRGRPSRLLGISDVVLVREDGPRGRWPLARITALLHGPDGQARAAVISLRGRTTRRPVNKLYALEAAGE
ncbi:hypothetical protein FJT64_000940 [Amphibalanus amphitrite]|uniref:DUF5641 domain-containing protein n=1 Tax=Amphibalanus amphitrite TaxID=1232801 RepID=A0A6A4VRQ4_AMPAM|nr:hypothetical protein FJT64_000940 [Amphibalanus amphitrite]